MRLIHKLPFTPQEIEFYRTLVFSNLVHGLKYLIDSMEDMGLAVSPENMPHVTVIEEARDLKDGEVFPEEYREPLRVLWADPNVQTAWDRGNEVALPEK